MEKKKKREEKKKEEKETRGRNEPKLQHHIRLEPRSSDKSKTDRHNESLQQ